MKALVQAVSYFARTMPCNVADFFESRRTPDTANLTQDLQALLCSLDRFVIASDFQPPCALIRARLEDESHDFGLRVVCDLQPVIAL